MRKEIKLISHIGRLSDKAFMFKDWHNLEQEILFDGLHGSMHVGMFSQNKRILSRRGINKTSFQSCDKRDVFVISRFKRLYDGVIAKDGVLIDTNCSSFIIDSYAYHHKTNVKRSLRLAATPKEYMGIRKDTFLNLTMKRNRIKINLGG